MLIELALVVRLITGKQIQFWKSGAEFLGKEDDVTAKYTVICFQLETCLPVSAIALLDLMLLLNEKRVPSTSR